jgi:hypothetical protein
MAGDVDGAIAHYRTAAGRTTSLAERLYLTTRAARLRGAADGPSATPDPASSSPGDGGRGRDRRARDDGAPDRG